MRILPWFLLVLISTVIAPELVAPNLAAQERWLGTGAPVAAKASYFESSLGYSYLNTFSPSAEQQSFMGIDAVEAIRLNAHWSAALDSTYLRANNVEGTGHGGNLWTALAGPVFYPRLRRSSGFFVRALAGMGFEDSRVRVNPTYSFGGWVAHFSYLAGGGYERNISRRLTLRLGADYQRTYFFNAENVIQPQNNVRLTTGIAYRFERR
jgi:hypothetical protein